MNIFKIFVFSCLVCCTSCANENTPRKTTTTSLAVQVKRVTTSQETTANTPEIAPPAVMSRSLSSSSSDANRIQIALLLDTSGSMDGLIEQAKSQLWKMVNELANGKKNGESPDIDLALYDYGNDGNAQRDGYVRQIVPLTNDLDAVSEKLFELRTNGGSEYCGQVILTSVEKLKWSESLEDFKLIIIAGNEAFTQGPVDYKDACKAANEKRISINTIFCGNYEKGISTQWRDGADCSNGKYMNIDHNNKVVHIPTPYDDEILRYNKKLNDTYIGYGTQGLMSKNRQSIQDSNAATYSSSNLAERAISKSKKQYKNTSWDLVDAVEENEEIVIQLTEAELPKEMKGMDEAERKGYIEKKAAERETIQAEMRKLEKKRRDFKAEKQKENAEALTLDNVMLKAIREQAEKQGYKFEF